MQNRQLQDRLIDELVSIAGSIFTDFIGDIAANEFDLRSEIERFMSLYCARKLKDNTGGSGFHNAFWLYLVARALIPNLIVESGVWKGHSSWLLRQACPNAAILGFDIDLSNLEHEGSDITFYEHDWSRHSFDAVDPDQSLLFFDCHVNHTQRIMEAHERGFKHMLFDDNAPAHKLYGYGKPPFPTANMLYTGGGLELDEISWCWYGENRIYQVNRTDALIARKLIKTHVVFPDVGGPTRYGGFSYLTYVQI